MSDNKIFSYTRRDYEGSRKEGISNIPVISEGNWTDLNATDPGIIILDYVHALVDMINYYQDHQALETFISTAKERENIFRIAKQLSYKIRSAKGALCEVTFSSNLLYDYTIKIPKDTLVGTTTGIKYLTVEDAYLLAGESSVTVTCTQGNMIQREYEGTGISRYSNISSASNQYIILTEQNIDIESIRIIDSVNIIWESVDYLIFSKEIDKVYQLDLNPDGTITISFGDGVRGVIPKENEILTISYIVTDAEEGRVSANMINKLENKIFNTQGQYIELEVNNMNASVGGSSIPTSAEIRELAPGAIKSQGRAITLSDFESIAKLVDGVLDAKAYDINTKPELCLYHEVKVLIIPKENVNDTRLLENKVYEYLSSRMIPPTNLQILSPSIVPINIDVTVRKVEYSVEGGLSYAIQETVENYFKENSGAIGEDFYPSDLIALIANISDVRSIINFSPSSPVTVADLAVAKLGTLNIVIQ